jgi:hypothetical protein
MAEAACTDRACDNRISPAGGPRPEGPSANHPNLTTAISPGPTTSSDWPLRSPRHGNAAVGRSRDGHPLEQQAGCLVKPCWIDACVLHEIDDAVASFGRPAGDDGR